MRRWGQRRVGGLTSSVVGLFFTLIPQGLNVPELKATTMRAHMETQRVWTGCARGGRRSTIPKRKRLKEEDEQYMKKKVEGRRKI